MVEQQLADWLEEGYVSSFRTACLILGNRSDAEEAVQDAYLRAWRFRDSLSAVPSIRPWLYRVVVNSCYSKLRREIPHRDRRAGDEPLDHFPGPGVDPETRAEQGEVAETVLAALQQLPLSLRVPVVLRYYADLSERDIALAIGRRPGTVQVASPRGTPTAGGRPRLVCPGRSRGDQRDHAMTMLDDDRLASLFAQAGATFDVPATGPDDIVARATGRLALDGSDAAYIGTSARVGEVDGDRDGDA